MKKFLLILLLFSFPLVLAGSCNPPSGYNWCYDGSYSDYGLNAYAKMYGTNLLGTFKSGYYVGEVYQNIGLQGDKLYQVIDGSISNYWNDASCGRDGCSGSAQEINPGKIVLASAGERLDYCPSYFAYDYTEDCDSTGCDWIYTMSNGNGYFENCGLSVKVVECFDNSDCQVSDYCDEEGTWQDWSCKKKECELSQTKCVGTDSYSCSNYKWINNGKKLGECGIECLTDTNCGETEDLGKLCKSTTLYESLKIYKCSSNKCLSNIQDNLLEKCDYKCGVIGQGNSQCIVKVCDEGNNKCSGDDLLTCQDNQYTLEDTCKYGCDEGSCLNPIKELRRPLIIIGGIISIIILLGFIFLIALNKRK